MLEPTQRRPSALDGTNSLKSPDSSADLTAASGPPRQEVMGGAYQDAPREFFGIASRRVLAQTPRHAARTDPA